MGSSSSTRDAANHFTYSYSDEPHATRRKLILSKYPQVKKLMGVDRAFKWQVLALVSAQLASLYLVKQVSSWWLLLGLAYCVGGVANHAIMLAIHEISHGMGFGAAHPLANKALAIFANLPIGVPMSISFKKYHLEHHRYQGDELLDTDIPSHFEARFFTNPARKLLWCLLQPFFYTMRPLFVHPKPMDRAELANILVQLAFDLFVVRYLGGHVLLYMIGGSVLAMGLHPVAGHFISEHTLMFPRDKQATSETTSHTSEPTHQQPTGGGAGDTVDQQGQFLIPETCSYYGPLNWLTFNVGYHVEHHDFPSIPGSRLYRLAEIAPEFYKNLKHHTSWTYVLWQYIFDPKVGPHARVRRPKRLIE